MKYRNFWGRLTIPSFLFRLILPPFVFLSPFFITITSFLLDGFDSFFYRNAGLTVKRYQPIDKFLDLYWYTFSIIYASRNLPYFKTLLALYLFRLVGQIVFYIKKDHKVFLLFPNFFEFFFLLLVLVEAYPTFSYLTLQSNIFKTTLYLFILKLLQEIFLHTKIDEWSYRFQPKICQWPKK